MNGHRQGVREVACFHRKKRASVAGLCAHRSQLQQGVNLTWAEKQWEGVRKAQSF